MIEAAMTTSAAVAQAVQARGSARHRFEVQCIEPTDEVRALRVSLHTRLNVRYGYARSYPRRGGTVGGLWYDQHYFPATCGRYRTKNDLLISMLHETIRYGNSQLCLSLPRPWKSADDFLQLTPTLTRQS